MEVHERLVATNPAYRERRILLESFAKGFAKAAPSEPVGIYTIPVVVHVIYNAAAENISDAQIKSQIAILNDDFRRKNADATKVPSVFEPLAVDSQIEFRLASVDPLGAATNGITRTPTTKTEFHSDRDDIKFAAQGGHDAWPADRYLNLWSAPRILDDKGQDLLGYAQFPGGDAATDGVVILQSALGDQGTAAAPFDRGRTATHEVGHWLNLLHIWGDDLGGCTGSDEVPDTPNQADHNFNKPAFPTISCNNAPNGDMFMNYMDYTDDDCMFMFTAGQAARMRATLAGSRSSIVASPALPALGVAPANAEKGSPAGRVFDGRQWIPLGSIDPQLRGVLSAT
jgi:hypothetical protein